MFKYHNVLNMAQTSVTSIRDINLSVLYELQIAWSRDRGPYKWALTLVTAFLPVITTSLIQICFGLNYLLSTTFRSVFTLPGQTLIRTDTLN